MECPKCGAPMETIQYIGIPVDRCSGCAGLWFDSGEAEALSDRLVAQFLDTGDPEIGATYDERDKAPCPRCGEVMESHFDLEGSQIYYEVCPTHGKFFDAGEFTLWASERKE